MITFDCFASLPLVTLRNRCCIHYVLLVMRDCSFHVVKKKILPWITVIRSSCFTLKIRVETHVGLCVKANAVSLSLLLFDGEIKFEEMCHYWNWMFMYHTSNVSLTQGGLSVSFPVKYIQPPPPTHASTHARTHARTHTHTHTHTYTHTHIHAHTHARTHTHTHSTHTVWDREKRQVHTQTDGRGYPLLSKWSRETLLCR